MKVCCHLIIDLNIYLIYKKSSVTVIVVALLRNDSTDFYEFFCAHLAGMRIGLKVYFIPLGDLGVPIQKMFSYFFDNFLLYFLRFGIKKHPNFHPLTLITFFNHDFSISTLVSSDYYYSL